eukprot:7663325-Ditylum_brightwellii.AAC.1
MVPRPLLRVQLATGKILRVMMALGTLLRVPPSIQQPDPQPIKHTEIKEKNENPISTKRRSKRIAAKWHIFPQEYMLPPPCIPPIYTPAHRGWKIQTPPATSIPHIIPPENVLQCDKSIIIANLTTKSKYAQAVQHMQAKEFLVSVVIDKETGRVLEYR